MSKMISCIEPPIVEKQTKMLKGSSKIKFHNMNFTFTKDTEISFHQLCSAFTIALIFCYLDLLFFIKMKTNASDFTISRILLKQYLETGDWYQVDFWSR